MDENNFNLKPLRLLGMGPTPKRELHCKICKSNFHSFKDKSNERQVVTSKSQLRTPLVWQHRNVEKTTQLASGSNDEINFDYIEDDAVSNDDIAEEVVDYA